MKPSAKTCVGSCSLPQMCVCVCVQQHEYLLM